MFSNRAYFDKRGTVLLRFLLIIVFAFSFITKLLVHNDFANFISGFTNYSLGIILSNIILSIELYLIIQLILSKNVELIIAQAAFALISFTIVLIALPYATKNCYCFGGILQLSKMESIFKNVFLIAIIVVWYRKKIILHFIKSLNKQSFLRFSFTIIIMLIFFQSPRNFLTIDVDQISVYELKILSSNDVLIVDARNKDAYNKSNIPTAINVPYTGQSKLTNELQMGQRKIIVVYCDGVQCSMAKYLARVIKKEYPEVPTYYLKGGLEKWQSL